MSKDGVPIYSIGTAARLAGLSVSTIRTWEARYGLVVPRRTETGHRLYSEADIKALRMLTDLIDYQGLRAGEAHRLVQAERSNTEGSE